jgi:hypothetical protein
MSRATTFLLTAALFSGLAGISKGQSLEELASQQRARTAQQAQPVKVYTNDNLNVSSIPRNTELVTAEADGNLAPASKAAASALGAEQGAQELDVTYQSFYNRVNNATIANVNGTSVSFLRFFPKLGLFSLRFEPLGGKDGFTTGEIYAQWKGLPWKGRHWDFSLGDFRFSTSLAPTPFTNIVQPDFTLRGANVTARTKAWRYSLYAGVETLTQGQRVPFRAIVPQTALGAEAIGNTLPWLKTGFRYLHLTSSKDSVLEKVSFFPVNRQFVRSDSLTAQTSILLPRHLEWYTETGWNNAAALGDSGNRSSTFSFVTGPTWTTPHVVIQANYVRQGIGYLPLLGYFLGDRRGPAAQSIVRLGRFDFSGSWSQSSNNLEENQNATKFFSRQSSSGMNVRLPLSFSLGASYSKVNLQTTVPDQSPQFSNNRLVNISLSRPVFNHNLRASVQQLDLQLPGMNERLRFAELEDTFHWKRFSFGGATRWQRAVSDSRKDSLFIRGNGQMQLGNFSLYGYLEHGKDLANATVFATSIVSTSVVGLAWQAPRHLAVQLEAFRNNFNSNLNPASIFILASQGIPIDTTLSRTNNWSVYLRVNRHFGWGENLSANPDEIVRRQAPLTGWISGFVRLRVLTGNFGASHVTLKLDFDKSATTNDDGYFEFLEVPEGIHTVALDVDSLPSNYNPSDPEQAQVLIRPNQPARAELAVTPLQSIAGTISDDAGNPAPEGVVVRLDPQGKYTTTDKQGRFGFYDLPEGDYTVVLEENSLPENARATTAASAPVQIRFGANADSAVHFEYRIEPPEPKPLRNVLQGQRRAISFEPNSSGK